MKALLRRSLLCMVAIIVASSLPSVTHAIDTEFYSANDILFYDESSVGACATTTNPSSSNVAIEDKIAQTMIVGFSTPDDATKTVIQKYKFGGVYFNGQIPGSVNAQTFDTWNASLPSQLIVASDDEGGQIQRFLADQDSAKTMGTKDPATLKTYAQGIGTKLKARGANVLLGPVLDLDTGNNNAISPHNRSFGTTSTKITTEAGAYAEGMTASGIGVTFKHFPGIGKNTANTDNTYQQLDKTITDLAEDVAPYKSLAKTPKSAVMLANEVLTGWGSDPVSLNSKAVAYLRNDIGFSGLIMTDDIGVFAHYSSNQITLADAVVRAYNAGVTMPLFAFTDDNGINDVISAVKTKVPETVIDAAYQKVMAYKNELGLKTTTTTATATATTPASATPSPTPTESTSGGASSSADMDIEARKQYIFQVLLGLGFTKEKAAAIWGNLYQESGNSLDPKALEYSGKGVPGYTGHGIVQWSWERWRTDYGDSKDAMRAPNAARKSDLTDFQPYPPKGSLDPNTLLGFAKQQNKNWYDLGLQIEFVKKEISAGGSRDPASFSKVDQFMKTTSTDVSELTMLWGRGYEGPSEADANWSNRISGANEALSKYGNLSAVDPGTGTASAAVQSGCGSALSTGSSSSGGPTGEGNQYTEALLKVPAGAYGRNVWYYNQGNAALNALNSYYVKIGHSWQECGCGPTSAMTIVASFDGKPIADPVAYLQKIASDYNGDVGCSGNVSGLKAYFQGEGYDVVSLTPRKGFHQLTSTDFDAVRKYLKDGYLIMTHTKNHFLGIYAADDSGNFYLFDPGARANTEGGKKFSESQLNSGSGMSGPAAGSGLNEFWAVKKNGSTLQDSKAPKAV